MRLSDYLLSNDLTLAAFADRLTMPVSTLHGYVSGRRAPSLAVALQIERETNGEVRPQDLLNSTPEQQRGAA